MCSVGPLNAESLALALQWDYTNVVMNWVILRRKGADRNLEWLKYFDAVRAQTRWGGERFDTLTWRVPKIVRRRQLPSAFAAWYVLLSLLERPSLAHQSSPSQHCPRVALQVVTGCAKPRFFTERSNLFEVHAEVGACRR